MERQDKSPIVVQELMSEMAIVARVNSRGYKKEGNIRVVFIWQTEGKTFNHETTFRRMSINGWRASKDLVF